jgi:hypothetical protein
MVHIRHGLCDDVNILCGSVHAIKKNTEALQLLVRRFF